METVTVLASAGAIRKETPVPKFVHQATVPAVQINLAGEFTLKVPQLCCYSHNTTHNLMKETVILLITFCEFILKFHQLAARISLWDNFHY